MRTTNELAPAPQGHRLVTPQYRPDIDGLRAVAVLAVVVYHAFPTWFNGGFVGVDVFFVISGFLISSILFTGLKQGTFSFTEFYSRRVRRIFPALIVVLGVCFAFGWFALLADEYMELGKHIAGAAVFASNFVLWRETGYFDAAAETKPLLHLWSLGIEEQFYVIWPFLLWAAWQRRLHVLAVLAVLAGASFAVNVSLIASDPTRAFYSPQSRLWELLVGGFLAYEAVFRSRAGTVRDLPQGANWRAYAGAGLLCLSMAVAREASFPGWLALLPTAGAYLIISAGPNAWLNREVLASKGLVWIGLISFPLYLWHWPILSFMRIVRSAWPSPVQAAAGIALAFVLAVLTYRMIEKPIRFGKRGGMAVSGLLVCMIGIGLAGYNSFLRDGLAFRSAVKHLASNQNELKRTPSMDAGCKAYVGVPEIRFPYCRYSDVQGATTVAVIGDSHAHVAFPGIAERLAARKVNTVLMANSSCPPLLGGESARGEAPAAEYQAEKEACRKRIEQIYAILAAKPEITKVFFFSRGMVYLTGAGFGAVEKVLSRSPLVEPAVFEAGLRNTAAEMKRLGKKLYFVLENPELGLDPASCITRPLRGAGKKCALDAAAVSQRQKPYLDIFARFSGAPVIGTIDAFCPNGRCEAVRDGKLLYADNNHLSVEGSRFQAGTVLGSWLDE